MELQPTCLFVHLFLTLNWANVGSSDPLYGTLRNLNLEKESSSTENSWKWSFCSSLYESEMRTEKLIHSSFNIWEQTVNLTFERSSLSCLKCDSKIGDCFADSEDRREILITAQTESDQLDASTVVCTKYAKPQPDLRICLSAVQKAKKGGNCIVIVRSDHLGTDTFEKLQLILVASIGYCVGVPINNVDKTSVMNTEILLAAESAFELGSYGLTSRDKHNAEKLYGLSSELQKERDEQLKKKLTDVCFGNFHSVFSMDDENVFIAQGDLVWKLSSDFQIEGYKSVFEVVPWLPEAAVDGKIFHSASKQTTFAIVDTLAYYSDESDTVKKQNLFDLFPIEGPYDAIVKFDQYVLLFTGHSFYVVDGDRGLPESYPKKSKLWSETIDWPVRAALSLQNSSQILFFKTPYVWAIESPHIFTVKSYLAFDFFKNCKALLQLEEDELT